MRFHLINRNTAVHSLVLALGLLSCTCWKEVSVARTRPTKTPIGVTYGVKRIADGDTITVVDGRGANTKVRFACIDAAEVPHTKQEKDSNNPVDLDQFKWGRLARNRLTDLIHQGGDRVSLTIVDTDRYGRAVAEVRLSNGTFVQEILAREGLAVVYTQYLKNCPNAALVEQAQVSAQQQKVGVWGDPQFVTPSLWRHKNK